MSSESTSDDGIGIYGVNGLENKGNTCYLNAILQVLSHLPNIVTYYGNNYKKDLIVDIESSLSDKLNKLIQVQYSHKDTAIEPSGIIKWLKSNTDIEIHTQQDCHEILLLIIDKLHEEVKYNMVFKTDISNEKLKEGFTYWNNKFSSLFQII